MNEQFLEIQIVKSHAALKEKEQNSKASHLQDLYQLFLLFLQMVGVFPLSIHYN